MGQIRREVRLEAREPRRQDITGSGALRSGSQPPSLEALGDHYLERGKAGAETRTLDSVIFPGQQGMEKEFKREWTWVSSGAGTGSSELSLNLSYPMERSGKGKVDSRKFIGWGRKELAPMVLDNKYVKNGGSENSRCT